MKKRIKYYPNGNKRSIRCDILDWHKPDSKIGFDGLSFTAVCKRCGRELLQDSSLQWFATSSNDIVAKYSEE